MPEQEVKDVSSIPNVEAEIEIWRLAAKSAVVLISGFLVLIPAMKTMADMVIVTKQAIEQHVGPELTARKQLNKLEADLKRWMAQYHAVTKDLS